MTKINIPNLTLNQATQVTKKFLEGVDKQDKDKVKVNFKIQESKEVFYTFNLLEDGFFARNYHMSQPLFQENSLLEFNFNNAKYKDLVQESVKQVGKTLKIGA